MRPSLKEYKTQDSNLIKSLFASIAKNYDKTNSAMSLFLHKFWNLQLVRNTFKDKRPGNYLDLCSGTGDIALAYLKKEGEKRTVVMADFCPQMLEEAKKKSKALEFDKKHNISYFEADAQRLPFEDASFDFITIAYGLRNIENPPLALKECLRVLKPAGRLSILELTRPPNPLFRVMHSAYLKYILPIIGRVFTRNQDAYEYLSESIQHFISPKSLKHLLLEIGFKKSKSLALTLGISHIITAEK
jgi:demethylmenaquinone methyltransferase / 2-methoxy-6-polyprenyl-1,4-benzoquinol methylase